jgi:HSP20 family protein
VPERGEVSWYRNERFNGNFRRAISLPEDIDPDSIEARYRDGVLQITAKRPETAKPRQIQVN